MPYADNTEIHSRTLTALFDSRDAADSAVEDLVKEGIPREHINLRNGNAEDTTAHGAADRGFWEELKDLFIPEDDRYSYAEGLRRGGYLLSVQTEEANYNRVLDVLDREGSVDMDERERTWKTEGWKGYGDSIGQATELSAVADGVDTMPQSGMVTPPVNSTSTATAIGQDAVSLYEEQLQVGKRDVSHGKVRLRSYVVETPVSEQVSLRSESVHVERRPVDRPVGATDGMFEDRVIEVEERAEEAVVSKTARVTEEISLRKQTSNETQTISDKLRHTEVEVDDQRSGHGVVAGAGLAEPIRQHMDVIAADGTKVGTVDHLDGPDRIKLAKNTSPDGQHHFIPLTWVDHVDQHVHLNKSTQVVQQSW